MGVSSRDLGEGRVMSRKKNSVCYLAPYNKAKIEKIFASECVDLGYTKQTRLSIRDAFSLFDIVLDKCSQALKISPACVFFKAMSDHLVETFQLTFGIAPKRLATV